MAAPLILELVDAVKDLANRDVENVSVICKLGKQNVKMASKGLVERQELGNRATKSRWNSE